MPERIIDLRINFNIISLIPGDNEPGYECDYLAFKSSKDINSYIGDEFDFINFYNNELIKDIESSAKNYEVNNLDIEKYMVYIYPNHKSMMSFLESGSNIQLFDNDKLKKNISLPEGGILNIINQEAQDLEVKLITKLIK